MQPKRIIILGATGSIGSSALDVAVSRPDLFRVVGLSAHSRTEELLAAGRRVPGAALCLSGTGSASPEIAFGGPGAVARMLAEVRADMTLNGISGAAGLEPSLQAIEAGTDLALANKETMVLAGRLVLAKAAARGVRVIPVDSEHSAVFQMVERFGAGDLEEVILTASGGAFRDRPIAELPHATPEEASTHPNWNMGRKITIDSASMANKGLEVIEAVRFFGLESRRVKVLIHPQSRVHALIRMRDGALYAQVSETDMRLAIQSALSWPRTETCAFGRLDLAGLNLSFREPDPARFPLLGLAYRAVEAGEGYTIAYNAANETAVDLFIRRKIRFTDLAGLTSAVLDLTWPSRVDSLEEVLSVDVEARAAALEAAKGF